MLGEVCGGWEQFHNGAEKGRLSGIDRAACLRIVPVLGIIPCRDTKYSIWSCQITTVRRTDRAVWKAAVNREKIIVYTIGLVTGRRSSL